MDKFTSDSLIKKERSEEEMEMIALIDKYEDIFDCTICRNLIDADNQKLKDLLEKSVLNQKDYLLRYTIREVDMDEWLDELIEYIAELEIFPESDKIHDFICHFFMNKELYRLNVEKIYGVIHHLYRLIHDSLIDNDTDITVTFENNPKITGWQEKSLEDLVADSLEDLWEPYQLENMYILYDEVYEIAEKIVCGKDIKDESELQKIEGIPKKIEDWKDELDLQRSEYRNIDDVEYLWNYFSKEILLDCEFIKTRNKEGALSERLKAKLEEINASSLDDN